MNINNEILGCLSCVRYFNEMSALHSRPRAASSPIPHNPSPSSSRPLSPGYFLLLHYLFY